MTKIKNNKYIIFPLLIMVLNTFFIINYHSARYNMTNLHYLFAIIVINIIIVSIFAFIIYKKESIKIEKMFLLIFIPCSICYLCLFPIGTIPDEGSHFLRAYEISQGHLVTGNQKWDSSIGEIFNNENNYKKTVKFFELKNSKQKIKYDYSNSSLYSFICYVPQSIGIGIAKIIGCNTLFQAYFGRICNLILFTIMMFWAIKIIPIKKAFVFLISLIPLVLQEAASLSPDSLTIATIILFVSSILYFRSNKEEKITKFQWGYLSLLTIVLSLCKIVYLPICFMIFLIPSEKFESAKKKNILMISLIVFVILINLTWLLIASSFLPANNSKNSGSQIAYILHNFPTFVFCIINTYNNYIHDFVFQSLGISLGTLNITLSYLYYLPLLCIFILVCLFDNYEKISFKNYEKLFIICIIFSVILLISVSLYVQWTPVGSGLILGIQGRYFIPLLILIGLLSTRLKIMPKIKYNNKYFYLFLLGLNVYCCFSILYHFI